MHTTQALRYKRSVFKIFIEKSDIAIYYIIIKLSRGEGTIIVVQARIQDFFFPGKGGG